MKLYRVKSESKPGDTYIVRFFPSSGKFVCECPDYKNRSYKFENYHCKHIKKTKKYLEQKNEKKSD